MRFVKVRSGLGGLGKSSGSERAPEAILRQMGELNANMSGLVPKFEIDDTAVVGNDIGQTGAATYAKAREVAALRPMFVGGDHSLTYHTMKALAEKHKDIGMIVFDAHPDMMQPFEPPTHENYLRMLIEEGIVKADRVILVGTRNTDAEEHDFIRKNKIKNYSMKRLCIEGLRDSCDMIMELAKDFGALYISIDIDAVDCACAPGTGYPEPCGLTSEHMLYFLLRLRLLRNIVGFDLVEVNPDKDIRDMTSALAARLIFELYNLP